MHAKASDIVRMRFELYDLLSCVEVETTEHKVIATADKPVLPRDEFTGTNRDICDFESFYDCRGLIIVEQDLPIVHRCQDPWFTGMEIDLEDYEFCRPYFSG